MPDRRARYRLSIVTTAGRTMSPRKTSKMLVFLGLLEEAEAQELAALLRLDQRLAGDWLERRGLPRTWRKYLRVEVLAAGGRG